MAKDITLFWGSGSPPCWRVMIALEEKGLQGYNHKLLSFEKQEHKSKEVLDINPRGQSQFRAQGTPLMLDRPEEQALMYQRMFESQTLQQKLTDVLFYNWRVPEAERHELSKDRYPQLDQYYTLLKDRPSIKASWPPHWQENPQGMDTLKEF
ncbi:hypothetical protein JZ751_013403 [Albula glossodonta]|uniref:GST N-terminal domain-containing protein n=1 Tax=Albula glossodonta TaxID=121402 RepID=A0A8T2MYE4_9TELE|nr:hypothetical protein JZ751_013403 [Albula glossodonta]